MSRRHKDKTRRGAVVTPEGICAAMGVPLEVFQDAHGALGEHKSPKWARVFPKEGALLQPDPRWTIECYSGKYPHLKISLFQQTKNPESGRTCQSNIAIYMHEGKDGHMIVHGVSVVDHSKTIREKECVFAYEIKTTEQLREFLVSVKKIGFLLSSTPSTSNDPVLELAP